MRVPVFKGWLFAAAIVMIAQVALVRGASEEPVSESARLEALLNEVQHNLADVETLRADFVQERHLSIMRDVLKSEGTLLFARPGRVRLEIRRPFRSVLVTSGESIARYELADGAWQKLNSGDAGAAVVVMEQIANWILGRFRETGGAFVISADFNGPTRIILTPADERLAKRIEAISLVLNDARDAIKSIKVAEPGGDYALMTFHNEMRNEELADALFDTALDAPVELDALDAQREDSPNGQSL